jgi:phosphoribosylformylglycinamidine cyclo-ligase
MGVGMVAVLAADDGDRALRLLAARGVPGWVLGEITRQPGGVRLSGAHPA